MLMVPIQSFSRSALCSLTPTRTTLLFLKSHTSTRLIARDTNLRPGSGLESMPFRDRLGRGLSESSSNLSALRGWFLRQDPLRAFIWECAHTESLSFFVLGSKSPPIVLIFGRNHALMPVTIQVACVEDSLFQHVHFSLRVIGTLLNLTWLRQPVSYKCSSGLFVKASFEPVNEHSLSQLILPNERPKSTKQK